MPVLRRTWHVSEAGDITINEELAHMGEGVLTRVIFHLPAYALRCAIANATGSGDGAGRTGEITDGEQ